MVLMAVEGQQDAILSVAITTAIFVVIFNLLCQSDFYWVAWSFAFLTVALGLVVYILQQMGKIPTPSSA